MPSADDLPHIFQIIRISNADQKECRFDPVLIQYIQNPFNTMEGQTRGIVALRDTVGHEAVVDALPDIITGLRDRGRSIPDRNYCYTYLRFHQGIEISQLLRR